MIFSWLVGCHADGLSSVQEDGSLWASVNDATRHQRYISSSQHQLTTNQQVSVFLESVDTANCSSHRELLPDLRLGESVYTAYDPQARAAVTMANVLNSQFRTLENKRYPLYNDTRFSSLVRAVVASDSVIYGSAIAFNPDQHGEGRICHSAYRDITGDISVRNLREVYDQEHQLKSAYNWFWAQRDKDHSSKIWNHKCPGTKPHPASTHHHNYSIVFSGHDDGLWTRLPYYDCSGGTRVWLATYSVPFFDCSSNNDVQFRWAFTVTLL